MRAGGIQKLLAAVKAGVQGQILGIDQLPVPAGEQSEDQSLPPAAGQHQILAARAGDVLHQILGTGQHKLLPDGLILVGVDGQIVLGVGGGGGVDHHQIMAIAPQGRLGDARHLGGGAFQLLGHKPVSFPLLQHRQPHVEALGAALVEHHRLLGAVSVQVTEQKGAGGVPLPGVFQLGGLPQIIVEGLLHHTQPGRQLRRPQKLLGGGGRTGREKAKGGQHRSQPNCSAHTATPFPWRKPPFLDMHLL